MNPNAQNTSLAATEAALRRLLRHQPLGLLTDIDGTISAIAPTPDAATVAPAIQADLATLQQHLALVAAVSGRAATDAAALVNVPGLVVVGNHGLELLADGRSQPLPAAEPFVPKVAAVLTEAAQQLPLPGLLFENKGVTGSIHYRLAEDPAAAEQQLGTLLHKLVEREGLRLTAGRMVWEIRPPLEIDKGSAVRYLVERYGLQSVIFLGDDRTDVDAFLALRDLRDAGAAHTLAVGVLAAETPAIVSEAADLLVEGVAGIAALLASLAAMVATTKSSPSAADASESAVRHP